MKFQTKYQVMLWKRYFDYGFGMTNYFKYVLYLFAAQEIFSSENIKFSLMIMVCWGVVSFFLGRHLIRHEWQEADNEVSNQYNKFQKSVRKSLNIGDPTK